MREQQGPRLTPVAAVPWSAICAHGYYREHRCNETTTTPPRSTSILMTHFVAGPSAGRRNFFVAKTGVTGGWELTGTGGFWFLQALKTVDVTWKAIEQ